MIKFFRKIRQNLLSEGKTTKYFKYAIGEIILVVIGILIALQVNNWNELRKTKSEQAVLLKSVKQDLVSDIDYLKEFIKKTDSNFNILNEQSQYANSISYSKDSLIHFLKKEINVISVGFKGFNNNTYESMKASGKLDLFDNILKEQLYDLSILQNATEETYKTFRDDYYDEIEMLVASYPIPVPHSFIKNTPENDFIWDNVNRKDLMLKLNSWGSVKANFCRSNLRNFNNTLDKTKVVLKIMEKEND